VVGMDSNHNRYISVIRLRSKARRVGDFMTNQYMPTKDLTGLDCASCEKFNQSPCTGLSRHIIPDQRKSLSPGGVNKETR